MSVRARRCIRLAFGALVAGSLFVPFTLRAQRTLGVEASLEAAGATFVREVSTRREFSGPTIGGSARLSFGRMELEGRYLQGSLEPSGGPASEKEDLADLALHVDVRVLPWLQVGAGPRLRAFIAPAGTVRWTRLEVRSRAEGPLIPGLVTAHAEVWIAPSVEVNVQGGGTAARGGSVGMSLHLPRAPVDIRIAYTADRASFASGGSEFLDAIAVSLAIRRD